MAIRHVDSGCPADENSEIVISDKRTVTVLLQRGRQARYRFYGLHSTKTTRHSLRTANGWPMIPTSLAEKKSTSDRSVILTTNSSDVSTEGCQADAIDDLNASMMRHRQGPPGSGPPRALTALAGRKQRQPIFRLPFVCNDHFTISRRRCLSILLVPASGSCCRKNTRRGCW